jgi:DNA invertase Pin-like site-specific DNA recombinase
MPTAVAYLRRSRVDTARPGVLSYEQQLQAVRKLAADHGDDPDKLLILEDWGKSGRAERQSSRGAFARLEAMIEAGDVKAVYAYSISRLARSLEVLSRLVKLCERQDVPIRCAHGHSPDVSDSTGRLITSILGAIEQWQAEWNQERMAEATALRRARGDHVGPATYGWRVRAGKLERRPEERVELLIEAYREAGSAHGAARLLTERGVPTRNGRPWAASSLHGILEREVPDLLPAHPSPGPKALTVARLAGLLYCPCGARLTARRLRRPGGQFAYECRRSFDDPAHPHPRTVVESQLLPWVQQEAARLQVPADQVLIGEDVDPAPRQSLEARRRRVVDNYEDGLVDKAERDAKLLAIASELERIAATEELVDVPDLDWTAPTAEVNRVLRAMWSKIELGPDLRPVRAEWLVPEWRAA